MNKFTLQFNDSTLEQQYQEYKTFRIRRPVYYGLFTFCFGLNVLKIVRDLVSQSKFPLYINYFFVGMMLLQVCFILRNRKYVKQALVFSNILSGLLQMNFNEEETQKQEFYSYGSSFTELQAVSYFISDFKDGILQVMGHLIMKVAITSTSTHKIDLLCTSFAVTGAIFILITIYLCDSNARNQYLSTVCEERWDKQLPNLIKKPFIKLSYKDSIINILSCNLIYDFPGYQSEFCDGCNGRQFIRNCQVNNKSLVESIIKQCDILNQTLQGNVKCERFNIRVCNFGVENVNRFVILEKIITKTKTHQLPIEIRKDIKQQIHLHQSEFLRFFNWGLLSFVLLNNNEIRDVKFLEMIKKLNRSYSDYFLPIQIVSKSRHIFLRTYSNLLRIFLIQIYHILIELHQKSYRVRVQVRECSEYVEFHILLMDSMMFQMLYQRNMFIRTVERKILYQGLGRDLRLYFSKQLPFN